MFVSRMNKERKRDFSELITKISLERGMGKKYVGLFILGEMDDGTITWTILQAGDKV